MKWLARTGWLLGVLLLALLAWIASLRAGWWATDLATARAKHATPPSRFVTVDGVELHYRDEGTGLPVVLLHGSIVNLHEWDLVADRLMRRFRVIRPDWPPYGLSGLDPKGVYTTARAADLVAGLADQLGVERFALVATSNGVNVALELNARHPGRITALALSAPPLERPSQTRKVDWRIRAMGSFYNRFSPDWKAKSWWRLILEDTTPPDFVPPEWFVETIYDSNNLPGAAQRQREYIDSNTRLFKTTDVGASAAKVTVPVLLQWCEQDTIISQSAERTIARFTNTRVKLIRYPQLGHFPMLENPDLFTVDLTAFLDETLPP